MKQIVTYYILLNLALLIFTNCGNSYQPSKNPNSSINTYLDINVNNDSTTIHSLARMLIRNDFENRRKPLELISHYYEWEENSNIFFQKKDLIYKSKVLPPVLQSNNKIFYNPIFVWNKDSSNLFFLKRLFENIKIGYPTERNWNIQDSDLVFEIENSKNVYFKFQKNDFLSLNSIYTVYKYSPQKKISFFVFDATVSYVEHSPLQTRDVLLTYSNSGKFIDGFICNETLFDSDFYITEISYTKKRDTFSTDYFQKIYHLKTFITEDYTNENKKIYTKKLINCEYYITWDGKFVFNKRLIKTKKNDSFENLLFQ